MRGTGSLLIISENMAVNAGYVNRGLSSAVPVAYIPESVLLARAFASISSTNTA